MFEGKHKVKINVRLLFFRFFLSNKIFIYPALTHLENRPFCPESLKGKIDFSAFSSWEWDKITKKSFPGLNLLMLN
jgi:hypothetical protein